MKKRKVLFLLPVAALILSGCTFQEGWETVSGFFTNSVYEPVKGFVENLFGKKEQKKEEKKEEQGGNQGEPSVAGDDVPQDVPDTEVGSIENPISVSEFRTQLDDLIDFTQVESGKSSTDTTHLFFVKAKVLSSSSNSFTDYGEIQYLNMCDTENSSLEITGHFTIIDSSLKTEFDSMDKIKGREVVVKGYGCLFNNASRGKTYQLSKKDNDHKPTIVKFYEVDKKEEPEKLEKTIAQIIQCEPTKSQAYISQGIIKSWATNTGAVSNDKTKYGNLIITDGQNDVFVYGASGVATDLAWNDVTGEYAMKNSALFLENDLTKDLQPGDAVDFWCTYYDYKGTKEMDMIITGKANVEVQEVVLSQQELNLEVGQLAALTATVNPSLASQEVTWSVVSDPATVQVAKYEDGKVEALAAGSATVTATSVADPTKSASCQVTVTEATKEMTSIEIRGNAKDEYTEGDKYSKEGLSVYGIYDNNSEDEITDLVDWSFSKETAEMGDHTITITATYAAKNLFDSVDVSVTVNEAPKGSELHPYSVTEAVAAVDDGGNVANVYAEGYVSKIVSAFNSQFSNITFNISADGLEIGQQLQGYRTAVASADDVAVGDKVVLKGTLKKYNGTYEFDAGNTIESRVQPTAVTGVVILGEATQTEYSVGATYNHTGLIAAATLDNGGKKDVSSQATWAISPETASANDTQITVTATYNNFVSEGFVVAVTVSSAPMEQVYKSCSFVAANTNDSISSYTATGTYTDNGFSINTANFNNNKKGWDFIKCGRKSDPSVATLTTAAAIDKQVSKVNISFTTYTSVSGTTAKVLVSSNSDMSNAAEYSFTPAADSTVSVPITTGVANAYYQVVFDCVAQGSTNGYIWVTAVSFSAVY